MRDRVREPMWGSREEGLIGGNGKRIVILREVGIKPTQLKINLSISENRPCWIRQTNKHTWCKKSHSGRRSQTDSHSHVTVGAIVAQLTEEWDF